MAEGVRDVNKLIKMKSDVPSMAAKVDALMDSVKPTYDRIFKIIMSDSDNDIQFT